MEILQKITKLNDSKFKIIHKQWPRDKKLKALRDNLWSMFDVDYYIKGKHKTLEDRFLDAIDDTKDELSVSNFGWTKNVKEEFYKHPYNKYGVRELNKYDSFTRGLFILDSEPSDIDDNENINL